jgi:hypothetical protein
MGCWSIGSWLGGHWSKMDSRNVHRTIYKNEKAIVGTLLPLLQCKFVHASATLFPVKQSHHLLYVN